jgi:phosphate transport system permease protein
VRLISRKSSDRVIKYLCLLVTIAAISPLIWIIISIVTNGASVLSWEFISSLPKPFGESGGGIGQAILGTFLINALASVWGIPVGIITGMYLSEYDRTSRLGSVVRTVVESLAGVPSLIFGVFAFSLIVLTVKHYTALAAAFALGLMMIPLIAKATEESMKVVSNDIREAAIALGIPKWARTLKIVLSIARGGVLSGSLLAFARISGETAPLLFTSLFSFYWPSGLDQPMATLQVAIYNYALSGFNDWVLKAWGASLILVIIVLSINVVVRVTTRQKFEEGAC